MGSDNVWVLVTQVKWNMLKFVLFATEAASMKKENVMVAMDVDGLKLEQITHMFRLINLRILTLLRIRGIVTAATKLFVI